MSNFENDLRQQLLVAERQLEDKTLRRLRQARSRALADGVKSRLPRFVVPAMGMATASIVALVLVLTPYSEQTGQEIDPDNATFYQELDFYYWLAESDVARRI